MLDLSYMSDYGMPYLFVIYLGLVLIMAVVALLSKRTATIEE